ncbi:MAG TPA: asparagine synthase (glutamine-hydrolyzing) [Acidobacteriota bacterium]
MCGIVGIMDLDGGPVDLSDVARMNRVIGHRGPDDVGYHSDAGIGLGMSRLSIIDLDTGNQPVGNEDGSLQVVLNGEIYNYRELRRKLQQKGHRFATAGDTETIVHLYEETGLDCVEHLEGMFAFALWDAPRQRLLVARDRLGIKPLYYGCFDRRLVFASELKSILQLPEVERRIDWESLDHLMTFLVTPRDASIIAGIHKLEPAHILVAARGEVPCRHRYWKVRFAPDDSLSEADAAAALREQLERSVRSHMVADVPLGAFLSGGIDSSAVVATMARLSTEPIKTYSIGFTDRRFSELEDARLVADTFGTDHHELVLEPDVTEIIEELAWFLDEPFGDSSAIPTYMVAKLAAGDVKVALSGDGGDELFGGYDRYLVEQKERRLRHLPPPVRDLFGAVSRHLPEGVRGRNWLHHMSLSGSRRYLDASSLFRPADRHKLYRPEVRELLGGSDPEEAALTALPENGGHWLSRLQKFDIEGYLPLDILTKVDRTSMAHSLEARVPLLDHKLVELAATIPPRMLIGPAGGKQIFKRAMRGILPERIIDKPKQGFAIPLGRWFRGDLDSMLRDVLLSDTSRRRGIFDSDQIERLIRRHEARGNLDLQLWTLLSTELWMRTFLDASPAAAGAPPGYPPCGAIARPAPSPGQEAFR